jgi:acetolactate synthase II small subunit
MMQHQLSIEARSRPEVLERVLRVVRHRGFRVCALNMAPQANAENINIQLTVASLCRDPANDITTNTCLRHE